MCAKLHDKTESMFLKLIGSKHLKIDWTDILANSRKMGNYKCLLIAVCGSSGLSVLSPGLHPILESQCVPVWGGGVLILRTLPNCYVNKQRLQSSSVFFGKIVSNTLE